MKRTILLAGILAMVSPLPAQAGTVQEVLDAQAANMRVIRQYNWATTYRAHLEEGKIVSVTAAGKVLTTGRVHQAVVDDNLGTEGKEVWAGKQESEGDREGFMKLSELGKLVYAYGLMPFDQQKTFLGNADISEGSDKMEGTTVFSDTDVLNYGDSVKLWVDSETGLSRKLYFSTEAIDVPVEVTLTYRTLGNGAVVLSRGHVTLPGETIVVDIAAGGYRFSN